MKTTHIYKIVLTIVFYTSFNSSRRQIFEIKTVSTYTFYENKFN